MTRDDINYAVTLYLAHGMTITVCKPARYKRRVTDLTRRAVKSRPSMQQFGWQR